MANPFLPIPASKDGFKIRSQDSDNEYDTDDFGFTPMRSPDKNPARKRKTTTRSQPTGSQRAAPSASAPALHNTRLPTTAEVEHVDLTRSEDDSDPSEARKEPDNPQNSPCKKMDTAASSADVGQAPNATPLPDSHEIKFLREARLQFPSEKPPFVRLKKKGGPRTVTLAVGDRQLPETAILANLVTRQWDSDYSYYTLDRNGERFIVKPFGGKSMLGDRGGNAYRTWSGQGNVFTTAPIAYAFKVDTEERPSNQKDVGDLESNLGGFAIHESDSLGDEDYSPTTSEASNANDEAHPALSYQDRFYAEIESLR